MYGTVSGAWQAVFVPERGESRATLAKRRADVAAMFDGVAERYDLANDVLSLGQDRAWRRAVVEAVDARPGERVLDLAAGTGTSSEPFADAGATVVPTDLSLGMLRVGKRRRPASTFVAGDALRLPYADGAFDAVTISFGLRNVEDTTVRAGRDAAGDPARRAARRLRVLHADLGTVPAGLHQLPGRGAAPRSPRVVSSNPAAYDYLAESIQAWPDQAALAALIAAAGWRDVEWRNLSGGIVALHRARRGDRVRRAAC